MNLVIKFSLSCESLTFSCTLFCIGNGTTWVTFPILLVTKCTQDWYFISMIVICYTCLKTFLGMFAVYFLKARLSQYFVFWSKKVIHNILIFWNRDFIILQFFVKIPFTLDIYVQLLRILRVGVTFENTQDKFFCRNVLYLINWSIDT